MTKCEPFFMTNPEWYYHDEKEFMYKLTDKATDEAKKSYAEFYDDSEIYVDTIEELEEIRHRGDT